MRLKKIIQQERWVALGVILLFQAVSIRAGSPAAIAEKGTARIPADLLNREQTLRLSGPWAFHWKTFIDPENPTAREPDLYGRVPAYWTDYVEDIPGVTGTGFGSYHLQLAMEGGEGKTITFRIPVFDTSYELFINGEKQASNGKPGENRETSEPAYQPILLDYRLPSDTLDLVFHVSNHWHRRGGFWKHMEVGAPEVVHRKVERKQVYTYSSIGILLAFAIFFLFFRIISPREEVMLLFSLTIFGIFLRSISTGLITANTFTDPSWSWTVKLEYVGTYLAFLFGILYLHRFFPARKMNATVRINTVVMSLLLLTVLVTSVRVFSYTIVLFQVLALFFMLYYIYRSLMASLRGNTIHILFFISLILFSASLVNDILISISKTSLTTDYITHLAFQAFILLQSIVLIKRWMADYQERVRLSTELTAVNENLEQLVTDRTSELKESLDMKNQLFSIIAHDLKNPVSNLAQYSDLLLENEKLKEERPVLTELKLMAYAAIELIDNLTFWGRQQGKQISYRPETVSLNQKFSGIEQLFDQKARWKEISLQTRVEGDLKVTCDAVLFDLVLRNMVSNGIKFTERGGRVTLSAKPENENIRITVEDTGIGIRREVVDALKQSKEIPSTPGTEQEKGTGLGLKLIHDLVEVNKSTLEIHSTPGKGTTLSFLLPRAE